MSTIQGSPAPRLASKLHEDVTTTDSDASPATRRPRPALGSRKSTNSVLMERRIREFEVVSQMLSQAMTADGADPEERAVMDAEAAETMTKLRTTLTKVRKFEKQHGRMPSEAELTEISSVDEDAMTESEHFDPRESGMSATPSAIGDHSHTLREELNESRAYASQLEHQIQQLNSQIRGSGDNTPAEGDHSAEATEVDISEHNAKMREMSSANQARLDHLRTIHWEEMNEVREQHQQDVEQLRQDHEVYLNSLRTDHESDIADKEDEMQRLKEQVTTLAHQTEETSKDREKAVSNKDKELATLRKQIEELNTQTAAALSAKNKYADGLQHQLDTLSTQLEEVRNGKPDTTESDAKLADLLAQLEAEKSKSANAIQQEADLAHLKLRVEQYEQQLSENVSLEARISQLSQELEAEKAKSNSADKDAEITRLKAEIESFTLRADPETSVSPSRDVSPVKSDAEKEQLRSKLAAMEKRHQAAKDNAKSKSAKQVEEHANRLAEALQSHQNQLSESQTALQQLQQY